MDPETETDAVLNVGVLGGKIAAVTRNPLRGRDTLDAKGLVVAPGFIDLHYHAQDSLNYRVQVLDGTTASFEIETGPADVDRWYRDHEGKALIHFGAGVGHIAVRMRAIGETGKWPVGDAAHRPATEAEINAIATGD